MAPRTDFRKSAKAFSLSPFPERQKAWEWVWQEGLCTLDLIAFSTTGFPSSSSAKPAIIATWGASDSPKSPRPEDMLSSLVSERGAQRLLGKRTRILGPRVFSPTAPALAVACQTSPLIFTFRSASAFVYLRRQDPTAKSERKTGGSRFSSRCHGSQCPLLSSQRQLDVVTDFLGMRSMNIVFSLRMFSCASETYLEGHKNKRNPCGSLPLALLQAGFTLSCQHHFLPGFSQLYSPSQVFNH